MMIKGFMKVSLIALLSLFFVGNLAAQTFSELDKSPADIAVFPKRGSDKAVKVVYSRPQANDREVFGNLVKYGKVWRTGANEATEITFYKDVKFGGKMVKAGTYSLFSIPNEGKWTIILNSELNQWGAYQYEEKSDVVRVEANVKSSDENVEAFSIIFDKSNSGTTMYIGWENTIVEIPIEF